MRPTIGQVESSAENSQERGFILISVLWLAGLLAVLAIAFTTGVRAHLVYSRNILSGERARFAADGMVLDTARRLVDFSEGTPRFDIRCVWPGGATIFLHVQDQGGLADLNTSSPALFAALLNGTGLNKADATAIEAALTDYRDGDRQSQTGGAEPDAYPGKHYGPRNAPFATVDELEQVPGMTDKLFLQLSQVTTVHSQQEGFDPTEAPDALLRMLRISRGNADEGGSYTAPSPRRIFAIEAAAEMPDGSRFVREAMMLVLRQESRPFAILSWQQGEWPAFQGTVAAPSPYCIN